MRMPTFAALATALAAATLVTGAGTAAAEDAGPQEDARSERQCLLTQTFMGPRCMNLDPATFDANGTLGYGSFGTGSLADLMNGIVNFGSVALSMDVPNSTGSYAPGSLGSYGPEASVGEVLVGSVTPLGGSLI